VRKSIIAKDGKAFFATLTEESQKSLEKQGEVLRTSDAGKPEDTAKELGVTVEEMNKMAPRDVAIGLMMAKVTDVPLRDIVREELPFLYAMIGALALITLFPSLVLFLPRLLGYTG